MFLDYIMQYLRDVIFATFILKRHWGNWTKYKKIYLDLYNISKGQAYMGPALKIHGTYMLDCMTSLFLAQVYVQMYMCPLNTVDRFPDFELPV